MQPAYRRPYLTSLTVDEILHTLPSTTLLAHRVVLGEAQGIHDEPVLVTLDFPNVSGLLLCDTTHDTGTSAASINTSKGMG